MSQELRSWQTPKPDRPDHERSRPNFVQWLEVILWIVIGFAALNASGHQLFPTPHYPANAPRFFLMVFLTGAAWGASIGALASRTLVARIAGAIIGALLLTQFIWGILPYRE